jgi:threonine/homoserine/homoserine lactone efflux protein
VPLAAAGIVCLGLVPTLGGPDQPQHWAVTAGMVGFGVLLWVRRRLRGPEGALQRVPQKAAREAAKALTIICGVVAALVGVIFGARLHSGGSISALSLALPAAGLCWLAVLAFQVWRYREPANDAPATGDRPSRRPSSWGSLSTPRSSRPPPDSHVSA